MNQIDKGYLFFGLPYNNLGVSVHLGPWVYFRSQEGAKPHSRLKQLFNAKWQKLNKGQGIGRTQYVIGGSQLGLLKPS